MEIKHIFADDKSSDFSGIPKTVMKQESIPYYYDTTEMPEKEKLAMKVKLERETKQICVEFSRLIVKVQQSLERNTTLDKLVTCLTELDDEGWLAKCTSIAQVFHNYKKFCTFYDTKMIDILISELGAESDREAYRDYKEKFRKYTANKVCKTSGKIGIRSDKSLEKMEPNELEEVRLEMNRTMKGNPGLDFIKMDESDSFDTSCNLDFESSEGDGNTGSSMITNSDNIGSMPFDIGECTSPATNQTDFEPGIVSDNTSENDKKVIHKIDESDVKDIEDKLNLFTSNDSVKVSSHAMSNN